MIQINGPAFKITAFQPHWQGAAKGQHDNKFKDGIDE